VVITGAGQCYWLHLYYQQIDGGLSGSVKAAETDTSVVITGLIAGATFSISVSADSSTLSSSRSRGPDITIQYEKVAYPVKNFEVISVSETSLTFSWSQPSTGAHLTTGYNLTCVPLLTGIPSPQSLPLLAPTLTSATLSGLFSGVPYNCSISTISDRGSSLPASLCITTNESGI
ncbi:Fibronectin, partial [Geodia barretti]